MRSYRHISAATLGMVEEVLETGTTVAVRDLTTRELLGRRTRLDRPLERHLFLPGRNNDVFATVAETMWVLSGRDDVAWLERYLPRAPDYSDNGTTWRGAYGPRLRCWNGRDQIDEVRKLLLADRESRRAVMSIFDPSRDFAASKDIPCTNWLGWIVRDNQLHMTVVLRSNDIFWGFSGVNSFEWTVLQEMIAFWLDAEVGSADFLAMSLHIYERHFERARRILELGRGPSPYDFGVETAPFRTSWEDFQPVVTRWFELEDAMRRRPEAPIGSFGDVGDPLLDSFLSLVHLRLGAEVWDDERLRRELDRLPSADWVAAAYQQLGRGRPAVTRDIGQPAIARFFAATAAGPPEGTHRMRTAIKRLHAEKNRAYGAAWKRRGELVSILPNIARKVDRLEALVETSARIRSESNVDTAVDLVVYVEKYRLFLAERMPPGSLLPLGTDGPLSDHDGNLELLVDRVDLVADGRDLTPIVRDVVMVFERCWRSAEAGATIEERAALAAALSRHAGEALAFLIENDKASTAAFLRSENA